MRNIWRRSIFCFWKIIEAWVGKISKISKIRPPLGTLSPVNDTPRYINLKNKGLHGLKAIHIITGVSSILMSLDSVNVYTSKIGSEEVG